MKKIGKLLRKPLFWIVLGIATLLSVLFGAIVKAAKKHT